MTTNPHSPIALSPAALASLDTGLAALAEGCAELPTADATLLRRAAKMGLKSEAFSREAIALAKQNVNLCPAGLDLEAAEQVIAVRDALRARYLQARQMAEQLEVALQVCGVDAFDMARTAYKSMKANCRDAALLELIRHLGRTFRSTRAAVPTAPAEEVPTPKTPAPPAESVVEAVSAGENLLSPERARPLPARVSVDQNGHRRGTQPRRLLILGKKAPVHSKPLLVPLSRKIPVSKAPASPLSARRI